MSTDDERKKIFEKTDGRCHERKRLRMQLRVG